jgi:osmoprotectant transport system permease protein
MVRRNSADKVMILGSLLGVGSLFFGWLTLRPNRLASGSSLHLWDSFGFVGATIVALLWLSVLPFCVRRSGRSTFFRIAPSLAATAIVAVVFILTGMAARRLLEGADSATRVSLGGGPWMTVAGASIVVYGSSRSVSGWTRQLIAWAGLSSGVLILASGWLDSVSIVVEYEGYRDRFWTEVLQHVRLTAISVAAATVLGVALGVWASRSRIAKGPILLVSSAVQTVPSLALFGLIIAPLSALSFSYPVLREIGIRGIGAVPAVIALTIYSVLPIVQNTYVGISRVDPAALDAGEGMGMSRWQILRRIQAPLAAPLVLEGIRIAAVQAVGLATVAAIVGAGGLGWFVFRGIGQAATDLIILGAIPVIVLAMVVDGIMAAAVRLGTPRGLRGPDLDEKREHDSA